MGERALNDLIVECIATACGADAEALGPHTSLREIGLDSLSLVTVAALVESATGAELDPDTSVRLLEAETVADLLELFG